MSEAEQRGTEQEEEPAATPFDNPYFLPVLLWLFAGWFLWDAWVEPLEEWLRFNRYGFGFLLGLAFQQTIRGLRPVPYLFAILMLVYAAWLAYMGFLGPAETWYSEDVWAVRFNRYFSGVFVLAAAISAFRERRRLASAATAAATATAADAHPSRAPSAD